MKLCQIWTCCSWYKYKSKKKVGGKKQKKIILPSAKVWHSAKWIFCRVLALGTRQSQYFAECQTEGTRQRGRRRAPLSRAPLCRVPNFAECLALGKVWLCRVPYFAECQTLGKDLFAECQVSPSAALGKGGLCRVPDIWHSAKIPALGKVPVSYSVQCDFYL